MNSLYIARKSADLKEAVTANLLAGGDNCSRGMAIGALFGAWKDEIPADWVEKVKPELWSEITAAAQKVRCYEVFSQI